MNAAILLSGGTGVRLGGSLPKQYISVHGRPIVSYALETLINFDRTDCLQIVAEERWRDLIGEEVERIMRDALDKGIIKECKSFAFSDPGRNRQESILHGLTDLLDGQHGITSFAYTIDPDVTSGASKYPAKIKAPAARRSRRG